MVVKLAVQISSFMGTFPQFLDTLLEQEDTFFLHSGGSVNVTWGIKFWFLFFICIYVSAFIFSIFSFGKTVDVLVWLLFKFWRTKILFGTVSGTQIWISSGICTKFQNQGLSLACMQAMISLDSLRWLTSSWPALQPGLFDPCFFFQSLLGTETHVDVGSTVCTLTA